MQIFFFYLVLAIEAATAVDVEKSLRNHLHNPPTALFNRTHTRFIEFTTDDGVKRTIDLKAKPDKKLIDAIIKNPASNNGYFLFTRQNPRTSQTLTMNNADSVTNSNFNANNPTVVIAHGWFENKNSEINPSIRDACLGKSDVNVIVLDWSRLAMSDYVTADAGVPAVGRGLGQFLTFLNKVTGAEYSDMHLVGFSLGAHVVGNAGKEIGGKAARVTGLDPAGPLWYNNPKRLAATDGVYVEAIHTNAGDYGIAQNVGNADFYPNGGSSQPGCIIGLCNHYRSWRLFAATVTYDKLVGRQCSNNLQLIANNCRGSSFHMGNNDLRKYGTGTYRLETGSRYPY